jgi:hypothetical protein
MAGRRWKRASERRRGAERSDAGDDAITRFHHLTDTTRGLIAVFLVAVGTFAPFVVVLLLLDLKIALWLSPLHRRSTETVGPLIVGLAASISLFVWCHQIRSCRIIAIVLLSSFGGLGCNRTRRTDEVATV